MKPYLSVLILSAFFVCVNNASNSLLVTGENVPEPINARQKQWTLNDFYSKNILLEKLTDSIYESLDLNQRAAQMIMTATGSNAIDFHSVEELYRDKIIGGILFLKGNKGDISSQTKRLMKLSAEQKIFAPVFSCDCEPTLFHQKIAGVKAVPSSNRLGSEQQVIKAAEDISTQMKEMGIHWNFAPVTDISVNRSVINNRSFGTDPVQVVSKSVSFIQASTKMNIATSIKHFPGHGAVKGDSHKQLVYIETIMSELDNFRQVIQMGKPISVMVGHIAVRNNADFGTKGLPATISENIIRKLLIDSLGFKGIVITDAMNMSAVKPIRGVDLKAVLAGNDMILFPSNPRQLHRSIVQILTTPGIQSERVGESIRKIIRLKICLGLVAQSNTFAS